MLLKIQKFSRRGLYQCLAQYKGSKINSFEYLTISLKCYKGKLDFLKKTISKCKEDKNPQKCNDKIKKVIQDSEKSVNTIINRIKKKSREG